MKYSTAEICLLGCVIVGTWFGIQVVNLVADSFFELVVVPCL